MIENPYASPAEVVEETPVEPEVWAYARELRLVRRGLKWMRWNLCGWLVLWPVLAGWWMMLPESPPEGDWLWWARGPALILLLIAAGCLATLEIGFVGTWYCRYMPKVVMERGRAQLYAGWMYFAVVLLELFLPGCDKHFRLNVFLWFGVSCFPMMFFIQQLTKKVGNMSDRWMGWGMLTVFWTGLAVFIALAFYTVYSRYRNPKPGRLSGYESNQQLMALLQEPAMLAVLGVCVAVMVILYGLLLVRLRKRISEGLAEHADLARME